MSEAEPAAKPKGGGKKKLIILVLAVLLLGGGAGGWFSGFIPRLLGKGEATAEARGAESKPAEAKVAHGAKPAEAKAHGAPAKPEEAKGGHGAETKSASGDGNFLELPDIVSNLNSGAGRRSTFLKLKAKLELGRPEDRALIEAAMPRVLDLFQGYLREMRPEELRGTAGTYRLREELLARTNLAAPGAQVVAVLFSEMLVQ